MIKEMQINEISDEKKIQKNYEDRKLVKILMLEFIFPFFFVIIVAFNKI